MAFAAAYFIPTLGIRFEDAITVPSTGTRFEAAIYIPVFGMPFEHANTIPIIIIIFMAFHLLVAYMQHTLQINVTCCFNTTYYCL